MKLEVFFDYACPYCLRGHEYLLEALREYAAARVEWRPCEAHPRPERHGLHSDLCARGMYIARELGADLAEYHSAMYRAAVVERRNIEDIGELSALVGALVDSDAFGAALRSGAYAAELAENNRLAWQAYGFAAVPSLAADGKQLRSVENVGLTRRMIAEFLEECQ